MFSYLLDEVHYKYEKACGVVLILLLINIVLLCFVGGLVYVNLEKSAIIKCLENQVNALSDFKYETFKDRRNNQENR